MVYSIKKLDYLLYFFETTVPFAKVYTLKTEAQYLVYIEIVFGVKN